MGQLDPEVYSKAKVVAATLKASLEPLIIGRKKQPFSCSCGHSSHGKATAVEIKPAGMDPRYEDQIGLWYIWTVEMREDDAPHSAPHKYSYSTGLSSFVDVSVLTELFRCHFAGIGVEVSQA